MPGAEQIRFVLATMFCVGLGLPVFNLLLGAFTSSDADTDADPDLDLDLDLDMDTDLDLDLDAEIGADGGAELDLDGDVRVPAHHAPGSGRHMIKFNMNCLCLAMVVFSALSYHKVTLMNNIIALALFLGTNLAIAALAYCLFYIFIVKRLKDNNPAALAMEELLFQHAIVKVTILEDGVGAIKARDALGAAIVYSAKLDKSLYSADRIGEGEEVVITEVDVPNKICYVTVADRKIL